MRYTEAILAGVTVWALLIVTFVVLDNIPMLKNAINLQAGIALPLTIGYSFLAASLYYRNVDANHGFVVGVLASATALLLDLFITVPLFEMPNGRGYGDFFGSPLLWSLVLINVTTFYLYGRRREHV